MMPFLPAAGPVGKKGIHLCTDALYGRRTALPLGIVWPGAMVILSTWCDPAYFMDNLYFI